MADVAETAVSVGDPVDPLLAFSLPPPESTSLQELIDSELALRISGGDSTGDSSEQNLLDFDINQEFIPPPLITNHEQKETVVTNGNLIEHEVVPPCNGDIKELLNSNNLFGDVDDFSPKISQIPPPETTEYESNLIEIHSNPQHEQMSDTDFDPPEFANSDDPVDGHTNTEIEQLVDTDFDPPEFANPELVACSFNTENEQLVDADIPPPLSPSQYNSSENFENDAPFFCENRNEDDYPGFSLSTVPEEGSLSPPDDNMNVDSGGTCDSPPLPDDTPLPETEPPLEIRVFDDVMSSPNDANSMLNVCDVQCVGDSVCVSTDNTTTTTTITTTLDDEVDEQLIGTEITALVENEDDELEDSSFRYAGGFSTEDEGTEENILIEEGLLTVEEYVDNVDSQPEELAYTVEDADDGEVDVAADEFTYSKHILVDNVPEDFFPSDDETNEELQALHNEESVTSEVVAEELVCDVSEIANEERQEPTEQCFVTEECQQLNDSHLSHVSDNVDGDDGVSEAAVAPAPEHVDVSSSSDAETDSDMNNVNPDEKKLKKKKKSEGGEKRTKKSKKGEAEKENISVKSSFSKFDQLSKKTVLHVRSVDASKVQRQFNQASAGEESQTHCKMCGKQVFQMELVKAERAVWHKNCFRCKECNKQLTVDAYQSNEGTLYCKPHFKELFKPKAVVDDEPQVRRFKKPELIIRESQPEELPPDVVRSSDRPDYGLEELSNLNVKSRFQVFEKSSENSTDLDRSPSSVSVKRSPSILSKLAKFQKKGMDVGVTDDALNGITYEESSSSSEEGEEEEEVEGENNVDIVRATRKKRERPMSFGKMDDVRSRWETGNATRREEMREERKQEIQNLRSRLFHGKQRNMKEMYEQAVLESERGSPRKSSSDVPVNEKARSLKERFEKGEPIHSDDSEEDEEQKKAKDEEMCVCEAAIAKKSRSLFLELDASAAKTQTIQSPKSPHPPSSESRKVRELFLNRQPSEDVVRASDQVEDVQVETAALCSKFKFFETYREPEKERKKFRITPPREGQVKEESPEREVYRDPDVVRSDDPAESKIVSNTASRMLSVFRQMEEKSKTDDVPDGPKPLKRFTPPPDYTTGDTESSEEEEEEEDEEEDDEEEQRGNPNIVRASDKIEDEFLKQSADRAKTLRAKFEKWESTVEKENKLNLIEGGGEDNSPSIDTTRNLRARFEAMKEETQRSVEKPRPKVNRFV